MVVSARYSAFLIHLGLSLLVLGAVFALARWAWYPGAYFAIAGVEEVLLTLLIVAVVLGPLLTLLLLRWQRATRRFSGLEFDLIAIGLIQGAALGYGAWALAASRPVMTVFDDGMFQISSWAAVKDATQGDFEEQGVRPVVVWARSRAEMVTDDAEIVAETNTTRFDKLEHAGEALATSGHPAAGLMQQDPRICREVSKLLPEDGFVPASWRIYPVYGRREGWSAVVDAEDASVVGFVHAPSRWVREGGEPRAAPPSQEVAHVVGEKHVAGVP